MRHHMYNPGFNFVKAPMEFNKNTERDTLQYCLGATLYMPGTKDIREKVVNHELPVTSFVMCCEDAIKEEDLPAAEQNILDTMDYFADQIEAGKITQDDIPLIFMRVRNPEQFKNFAQRITKRQADILVHPMEAVEIVATMTCDQELLAAAALHDTVEDTDVTLEQIRAEFGERVAAFVAAESDEPHQRPDSVENWRKRKQAAIDRIAHGSRETKIVALGDKLSNMRTIARDYAEQGDKLWNIFHAKDRKDHEWHYWGLADSLKELQDTFAYKEFEQLINQVFPR